MWYPWCGAAAGQGSGLGGWGIVDTFFSILFPLLVLGGIILLIYWLVTQFAPAGISTSPSTSRPLEILKERFAKGEINKEEYELIKKTL